MRTRVVTDSHIILLQGSPACTFPDTIKTGHCHLVLTTFGDVATLAGQDNNGDHKGATASVLKGLVLRGVAVAQHTTADVA